MPRKNREVANLNENTLTIFGERVKELRTERGLTQGELSELIGFSSSAISMYERGDRNPDISIVNTYADFFDVPVDYLLGKTNVRKPLYKIACFSDLRDEDLGKLSKNAQQDIKKFIEFIISKENEKK